MTRFWLIALLALLPLAALAQDAPAEEPAGDEAAAETTYVEYTATGYGFSLELPENGTVKDPSSEDWTADEQVAFEWYSDGSTPVTMIQCRVDRFATDLDDAMFDVFCDTVLEMWSDENSYDVVTANRRIEIDPLTWNLIEVGDKRRGEEEQVHYSVFSMYSGAAIYTVSMFYMDPVSEEIQEFGIPVVYSFELAATPATE